MSQRPASSTFLFPRAAWVLATGLLLSWTVPTLAPGFLPGPSVRPAQAAEAATPDSSAPDSSATDDSDDSAGDSDDGPDDPPLPYSQDEPLET